MLGTTGYTTKDGTMSHLNSTGMDFSGSQNITQAVMGYSIMNEEDKARYDSNRIGPFSFEIDEDIDTEILKNDQVYDDLKELKDIMKSDKEDTHVNRGSLGRSKRKK